MSIEFAYSGAEIDTYHLVTNTTYVGPLGYETTTLDAVYTNPIPGQFRRTVLWPELTQNKTPTHRSFTIYARNPKVSSTGFTVFAPAAVSGGGTSQEIKPRGTILSKPLSKQIVTKFKHTAPFTQIFNLTTKLDFTLKDPQWPEDTTGAANVYIYDRLQTFRFQSGDGKGTPSPTATCKIGGKSYSNLAWTSDRITIPLKDIKSTKGKVRFECEPNQVQMVFPNSVGYNDPDMLFTVEVTGSDGKTMVSQSMGRDKEKSSAPKLIPLFVILAILIIVIAVVLVMKKFGLVCFKNHNENTGPRDQDSLLSPKWSNNN